MVFVRRRSDRPAEVEQSSSSARISRRQLLAGGAAAAAGAACRDDRGAPRPTASQEPGPVVDRFCAIAFFSPHEARTVDAAAARILPGTPDDPGAREAGVVNYIDCLLGAGGFAEPVYLQGPFPAPDVDPATPDVDLPADLDASALPPLFSGGEPIGGRDAYPVTDLTGGQMEAVRDDSIESSSYGVLPLPKGVFDRYGWQSALAPPELYRRGLRSLDAFAQRRFGVLFADAAEAQQDELLTALEADDADEFELPSAQGFFELLRRHVIEGMFADPIHGGNRDFAGWDLIGYPGAYRAWTPGELRTEGTRRPPQSIADLHRTNPGHTHREEPTLPVANPDLRSP